MGRPFDPAQGLRALAHGQAHGGSGKDDRRHGSERGNCSTVHPVGVGDLPWVIFSESGLQNSTKCLRMMVARDGVERFYVVCFQQLTDSTKDTKDTEDRKDTFLCAICVRFFFFHRAGRAI